MPYLVSEFAHSKSEHFYNYFLKGGKEWLILIPWLYMAHGQLIL